MNIVTLVNSSVSYLLANKLPQRNEKRIHTTHGGIQRMFTESRVKLIVIQLTEKHYCNKC